MLCVCCCVVLLLSCSEYCLEAKVSSESKCGESESGRAKRSEQEERESACIHLRQRSRAGELQTTMKATWCITS